MRVSTPVSLRTMELLAPAGTLSAFEAAIREGADAVYVGAPGLNARAMSRDFSFAEIEAMARYAHQRGRRLYVAINSLMKEDEIPLTLKTLDMLARIRPDALIIQDMGIARLAGRFFPELALHASTLMAVHNALAAGFLLKLGFQRVVLARELSLEEIGLIHQQSAMPLEIFIHGAMCFSYSGLCRFSSFHGGRSSLRGQCVQPCRRPYLWAGKGKHPAAGQLFSMNDLCGIDSLAAIRAAGVVSLKIEGRLRSVTYVARTVRAYRLALDALDAPEGKKSALLAEARKCLEHSLGRRPAPGFFSRGQEDKLISPHLAGGAGELVGRTVPSGGRKGRGAVGGEGILKVLLRADIRTGDRMRFYEGKSGERFSFTLRGLRVQGREVAQAKNGQTAEIVLAGMRGKQGGSVPARFQGLLFRVDVAGRKEKPGKELSGMVRASSLREPEPGDMKDCLPACIPEGRERREKETLEWRLRLASLEDFAGPRFPFPVSRLILEMNNRNLEQYRKGGWKQGERQVPLIWALPPLIAQGDLPWYAEAIAFLRGAGESAFQIGHWSQVAFFACAGQPGIAEEIEVCGDYTLNALNSAALQRYEDMGLAGIQFSVETDRKNLLTALAHFAVRRAEKEKRMRVGLLVHGRPPLFSSRLDAPHFQGQKGVVSIRGERYALDRDGGMFYVRGRRAFSLLPFLRELDAGGLDYAVVDLSRGNPLQERGLVASLLSGRGARAEIFSGNYDGLLA